MPGVEFQTAWKTAGPVTVDMGLQLVATHSFADCWRAPDVLFVPGGGMGVCETLQDDELLDEIAAIGTRVGWVTSVCTGALLLGAAGLLKGYRSACYWYTLHHLEEFGATPDEARYVIGRNRASGGGMTAGIDFALHMIGIWNGVEHGRLTELFMEYARSLPSAWGVPSWPHFRRSRRLIRYSSVRCPAPWWRKPRDAAVSLGRSGDGNRERHAPTGLLHLRGGRQAFGVPSPVQVRAALCSQAWAGSTRSSRPVRSLTSWSRRRARLSRCAWPG
jgi:cyclohexyl-isocyanide hydratase